MLLKELLEYQKDKACSKQEQRLPVFMMTPVTMSQCKKSYNACHGNHHPLKEGIIDYVDAKYRQRRDDQGKKRAMDSTYRRSQNTQEVGIYSFEETAHETKIN